MMEKLINHIYILSTIFFTVYSQLIIRWQVSEAGSLPIEFLGKMHYVLQLFLNPWIMSSIFATLCSGISWMLALSKFEISYAFPWMSLNFVIMFFLGFLFFNDSINLGKVLGSLLVISGLIIIARA